MSSVKLTLDEMISTLRHSDIDCIFIEGKDDKIVFDIIKDKLEDDDIVIDFFPCDGRNNLLNIYDEHDLFHFKSFFFSDSDMWIFNKYRESIKSLEKVETDNFVTTNGYSIENDLFNEAEETLLKLLNKDEKIIFDKLIQNLCPWFSYQVHLYLNNQECNYAKKKVCSTNFIDSQLNILDSNFNIFDINLINEDLRNDMFNNYKINIRGKILFQIFNYIFDLRPKKDTTIKYTTKQLFDISTRHLIDTENSFINNNIQRIKAYF